MFFVPNKKLSNRLKNSELSELRIKRNYNTTCKKKRCIKGYKSMSEDELLSSLTSSKPVKKVKIQKQIFLKQE